MKDAKYCPDAIWATVHVENMFDRLARSCSGA